MTLAYVIAIAEARSCLAALADSATDFDESVHYEHLLLDTLHPVGPGLSAVTGTSEGLLDRLEAAVDLLIDLGGNGLSLELLLDSAASGAGRAGCRCHLLESTDESASRPRRSP